MPRTAPAIFVLLGLVAAAARAGTPPRLVDKADYQSRLHGMWLGECLANWTGIRTEGRRSSPPFLTDADWGANPFPEAPFLTVNYSLDFDPWYADDDTDIEYVYLHLLTQHAPATRLTARQITDGWIAHCNSYIWVSNASARLLMSYAGPGGAGTGVLPPATAFAQPLIPPYADQSLMIDAQLTTELFGALAPGMPGVALEMADMPVRTTATGYAAHAAQFYIVLYSLATRVDRTLPPEDQALWLVRQARKFIPDTSKAADVIDSVVSDFLANPDHDNWERTRDLVYARFQGDTPGNGYRYRAWYESSVNLATGTIALLYGRMDLLRTVRIGTLSGWDSDNGTATMGGLLGLIGGYDAVVNAVSVPGGGPGWPLGQPSDRFWIARTRSNLPDYLPSDAAADDTLVLMAQRCMPIIERVVVEAGGRVSGTQWLLPPGGAGDGLSHAAALLDSPTHRETLASANAAAVAAATPPWCDTSVPGSPSDPAYGSWYTPAIADNLETNFRGAEVTPGSHGFASTQRAASGPASPTIQSFTVQYAQPLTVAGVRFIEGDHFYSTDPGAYRGGWFQSASIELLIGGQWIPASATPSEPLDPLRPFQLIDYALAAPVAGVGGVRITGQAGGGPHPGNPSASPFVTCAELDALGVQAPRQLHTFDLNADGLQDAEDLYAFFAVPVDLDADGAVGNADVNHLRAALRWTEAAASCLR